MTTTVYQKFIARYGETFTLVSINYDTIGPFMDVTPSERGEEIEVIPYAKVKDMDEQEFLRLVEELTHWQNEKATWWED